MFVPENPKEYGVGGVPKLKPEQCSIVVRRRREIFREDRHVIDAVAIGEEGLPRRNPICG